jgi:hypothetical protein
MPRNVYIVPVNTWFVERAVWVIAGTVVLGATALAWYVHPLFVLLVAATGIASILVAFTGFDLPGSILVRMGMPAKLADPSRKDWYFARTDSWYLERRIFVTVGFNLTLASVLSLVHSAWWLAFTGFVGAAMYWFAATGFCIMANILYWIGAEPRLAPEFARARGSAIPAASPR